MSEFTLLFTPWQESTKAYLRAGEHSVKMFPITPDEDIKVRKKKNQLRHEHVIGLPVTQAEWKKSHEPTMEPSSVVATMDVQACRFVFIGGI